MNTVLVACLLGLVVGGVLGLLGGGGAILTVPVLVYVFGQSAAEATTGSLVIVGAAALTGVVTHRRDGLIRWRLAGSLAVLCSVAAWAGSLLSRQLDHRVLLVCFGVVMLMAAAAVIRPVPVHRADTALRDFDAAPPAPLGTTSVLAHPGHPTVLAARGASVVRLLIVGLMLGFVTGFLGVGGGFLVVPVLIEVFRLPLPAAAATSLLVITLNSGVSLATRLGHAPIDWVLLSPLAVTAMVASVLAAKLAGRMSPVLLSRVFAAVLIGLGVVLVGQNATALAS